jgi:hypothetical protein
VLILLGVKLKERKVSGKVFKFTAGMLNETAVDALQRLEA